MLALCSNMPAQCHIPEHQTAQQISSRNNSYYKIIALVLPSLGHAVPQQNVKLSEHVRLKAITAVLLRIRAFWDVMYCGSVPPGLLTNHSALIFRVRQFFESGWPRRLGHYDLYKIRNCFPKNTSQPDKLNLQVQRVLKHELVYLNILLRKMSG